MNDNTTPKAPFPFTMTTTAVMEHSGGVAWTADLRQDGLRIGFIEQDGRGGADRVNLLSEGARKDWTAAVAAAFDGNEEVATYWLLVQEESESVFGEDVNA